MLVLGIFNIPNETRPKVQRWLNTHMRKTQYMYVCTHINPYLQCMGSIVLRRVRSFIPIPFDVLMGSFFFFVKSIKSAINGCREHGSGHRLATSLVVRFRCNVVFFLHLSLRVYLTIVHIFED